MKKIWGALFIIGLCTAVFAGWEAIGPFGGPLNTVEIAPSNEDYVYTAMATFSMDAPVMMFRSSDGGSTWTKVPAPPMVSSLAIDPFDPLTVYAGTGIGIVFKSIDGGMNWTQYTVNGAMFIMDITVHPTSSSILYAAGVDYASGNKMAFYKSVDAGANWNTTILYSGSAGEAYTLTVYPSDPQIVYVGGQAASSPKVFKSTNGGNSFVEVSGNIDPTGGVVKCLAVNTGNSHVAYAATFFKGIYKTTNSGVSWTLVRNEDSISCLATAQTAPDIIFAGKDILVLKSTDAGNTWFVPGSGYGGESPYDRGIAVSRVNSSLVHSTCRQGFFTSVNGGATWGESNWGICMAKILDIECAPSSPAVVYTSTKVTDKDGPIYQSLDSGSTWTMTATPIPNTGDCGTICRMAVHNSNANSVYALEGVG
jgi:photosystem II stability/assembly factor-like uncharacterized protein